MKKNLLIFIGLSVILTILSYYFIDRQLVFWLARHHSHHWLILHYLANGIINVIIVLIFLFYLFIAARITRGNISTTERKLLLISNVTVIGCFLKDLLKFVFARYWTDTFKCQNLSLVKNHVYGFHFFSNNVNFGSFPSGHATYICGFSVAMWLLFPKWRWLSILLIVAVLTGQIGMYYHFVSDIIAGATLGTLIALTGNQYREKTRQ